MSHRSILALALAAFTAPLLVEPLPAQVIQVNKDNKTIAITATDSAEAESDTADIAIGFTAYGSDEQKTYADSSATSNRIVAALTGAGIPRDNIRSTSQSLTPIDPEDKARYGQGIRFMVSQNWKVTTNAANAANTLHLAVLAGANNSGNIDWRLADDNALEAEASSKALTHAQQVAQRMAEGLHARLGPLVYASNQLPQRPVFGGMTQEAMFSAKARTVKPLAILPDKVSRSATVYAVFSIE